MMKYNGKSESGKRGEIEKEKDGAEKRGFVKSRRRRDVHGQAEPDL